MIVYFIGLYIVSLLLGYELALTRTTLLMGRSISDTNSGTGYQNAITPPLSSYFGLGIYAISLGTVVYGFIKYGWLVGIAIFFAFFLLVGLNKAILLPKDNSEHFRNLIIKSMMRRHANYLKSGDEIRASAMKYLLEKLDVPISEFVSILKNNKEN